MSQIFEEVTKITTTCAGCGKKHTQFLEGEVCAFTPENWFWVADVNEVCDTVGGDAYYCGLCIGDFVGSDTRKIHVPNSDLGQENHWFKTVEEGLAKRPAKTIKYGRRWAVELHGRRITGPLSKAEAEKFLADLEARWVSSKRP